MVKSRKERAKGKKKKPWHISKDRRGQLLALFLVLLMVGSGLLILFR